MSQEILSSKFVHELVQFVYELTAMNHVFIESEHMNDLYKAFDESIKEKNRIENTSVWKDIGGIIRGYIHETAHYYNADDGDHGDDESYESPSKIYYEIYDSKLDDIICQEEENATQDPAIDFIINSLDNPNTLLVPKDYKIVLINDSEWSNKYNKKGRNQTKLKLDFHRRYTLPTNTLKDFIDGCYRIKRNKFDKHYEKFYNVKITKNEKKRIFTVFLFCSSD
jgi:hypothetical protein